MTTRLELPRIAHAGVSGPDVYAYSRTLKRVGIRLLPATHSFGVHMVGNVEHFQRDHHLAVTGHVGQVTFDALKKHFDGYDRYLIEKADKKYQPHGRDFIVGACLAMLRIAPFPYEEVRPYPSSLALLDSDGSDCSGTATMAYRYAHAHDSKVPDPNNMGFDGYGSTYTMIYHGSRVNTPLKGDLVFYYPTYSHVGVYLGNGRVFSHGKPGDPHVISASFATQFRRYFSEAA